VWVGRADSQRLEQAGHVITVTVGEQFSKLDRSAYAINPQNRDDYNSLMQAIWELGKTPNTIAHLWSTQSPHQSFDTQNLGFYSLMFLTQALGQQNLPILLNLWSSLTICMTLLATSNIS